MCKAAKVVPDIAAATLNHFDSVQDQTSRYLYSKKYNELLSMGGVCTRMIEEYRSHPNVRKQVVHGDLAHYNVIAKLLPNGRPAVSGVIDFGDAMRTWLIGIICADNHCVHMYPNILCISHSGVGSRGPLRVCLWRGIFEWEIFHPSGYLQYSSRISFGVSSE